MFSPLVIGIAFVLAFICAYPLEKLQDRKATTALAVVCTIGLLASLVCLGAGLDMVTGWTDPLRAVEGESRYAARGRGRVGLVLLATKFWPWVLMGTGAFFGFGYSFILWRSR